MASQIASSPASPSAPAFAGRVALVVSNLEHGGAQRQVIELANRLNANGVDAIVVSLSHYVPLAAALHDASARLHVVEKRHPLDATVIPRLAALLRRRRIDLTHAFLVDAEVAARLAGALYHHMAVVGSERNSDYVPKRRHALALRLTKPWCAAIIANSNAGRRFRMRVFRAAPESVFVVHNGVDVDRFAPASAAVARATVGIDPDVPVVGIFASFKVQKNHPMFFRMARRVLDEHPRATFLCVGGALHGGLQGSDAHEARMREMVRDLDLQQSVRFVGNQDEPQVWYAACDVTVLTSRREGTPNALLESMACGVPVVATDVADHALVVPEGRAGFVVPYDDDAAMAERVLRLLARPAERREMGRGARAWVETEFSLARLAEKTTSVYRAILERRGRSADEPARGRPPEARRAHGGEAMKRAVSRKNLWEHLPPAVKKPVGLALSIAPPALLLGGSFRRWRRVVADADRWSADEVRQYQLHQLRGILQLAGERSSFYRASFRCAGFDPGLPNGVTDLQKLPLIDKKTINEHADELLVIPRSSSGIDHVSTGGSSGEPLRFLIGAGRSAIEFAHLVSCWARAGYGLTTPLAVFRGQLIAPDDGGLRHQFDPVLRRHYYSSFHMDDESVGRYLAHVGSIGPCYLLTYPSSTNMLVRYLKRNGVRPPANIEGVLAGSENVYVPDRKAAEAAFGVRYYTWFGHSEKLVMAGECERSSRYHVLPTYGYCELVDDGGRPVRRPGERGEIVGTGFINRVMPFIRYRTGDYATYAGDHCEECGRHHLLLEDVRGHNTQEMLVAKDGSLIPWAAVNTHEDTFDSVRQFQFAQSEVGRATLRVVPSGRPDEVDVEKIRRDMATRLQGRLDFDVQVVPEIRLTDRGKSVFVDQRLDTDAILGSGAARRGGPATTSGPR